VLTTGVDSSIRSRVLRILQNPRRVGLGSHLFPLEGPFEGPSWVFYCLEDTAISEQEGELLKKKKLFTRYARDFHVDEEATVQAAWLSCSSNPFQDAIAMVPQPLKCFKYPHAREQDECPLG
jgi:hypothetical protein